MKTHTRHRSDVSGNTLRLTIPSLKKWTTIISLALWLALWSILGGIIATREAFSAAAGVFLLFWIGLWAVVEFLGVYHPLWQLFGQEKIEVTPDSLAIRQAILGIGGPAVYARELIRRMRVAAAGRVAPYAISFDGISLSKGTGLIAFDYLDQTIRMGIGVDEAEARAIVGEIERWPVVPAPGGNSHDRL